MTISKQMRVPQVMIRIESIVRSCCEDRRLGQSQLSSETLRGCFPTAAIMLSLSAGVRTLHGRPAFTNAIDQNNDARILVLQFQFYCHRHRGGEQQVRLVYVRRGQLGLGQVTLEEDSLGQVRLGQVRRGQLGLGQVRLGQVRRGQLGLGQVSLVIYIYIFTCLFLFTYVFLLSYVFVYILLITYLFLYSVYILLRLFI